MITVGIDPSINSTGVCVNGKKIEYYIISSKVTKKMLSFKHKRLHILGYEKEDMKDKEYSEKESIKTENLQKILNHLKTILKKHKPDIVYMEGISYGSTGSAALADLAGLNFAIRLLLSSLKIPFIIIPPISLKIFATNNAGANKEEMIWSWKLLDPEMKDIKDIKIDDLADAYFLSRFTK